MEILSIFQTALFFTVKNNTIVIIMNLFLGNNYAEDILPEKKVLRVRQKKAFLYCSLVKPSLIFCVKITIFSKTISQKSKKKFFDHTTRQGKYFNKKIFEKKNSRSDPNYVKIYVSTHRSIQNNFVYTRKPGFEYSEAL